MITNMDSTEFCNMGIASIVFFIFLDMVVIAQTIPTTLQGPFTLVTHSLDPSLRLGSDDLPMDNPRLKRNVTAMFPEQIALALSSSSSMWVSWVTRDSQIGLNVTALDPSTVASEVWYGKESGNYSMKMTGVSTVYSQLYPYEGLWNYTSGIIHHVKIDGKEVTQLF
ncbi:purple acid phosphatase 23-like [Camellia sinensis]|uniref:purple acid phosphatase 23-like n=1 Tax=Camellia sinensis TaxID=4442 RepID=UPI001035AA91|nr:purple acid phosphatase 23-like [Camellia sinensis]